VADPEQVPQVLSHSAQASFESTKNPDAHVEQFVGLLHTSQFDEQSMQLVPSAMVLGGQVWKQLLL
jgi:hypothetical protein